MRTILVIGPYAGPGEFYAFTVSRLGSAWDAFPGLPASASYLCNGDGGDQLGCTPCPCSNEAPQGTTGGCLNSTFEAGQLYVRGCTEIADGRLGFDARGIVPGSFSILVSGSSVLPIQPTSPCVGTASGVVAMSLDGLRCAGQNLQRHGTRQSAPDGSIGVSTPGWGEANIGWAASQGFLAGQTSHFQVIYREFPQLGCVTGLNTTQAATVIFQP